MCHKYACENHEYVYQTGQQVCFSVESQPLLPLLWLQCECRITYLNTVASKSELLSSHECGSTKSPPKVLSVYRFSQLLMGKQYFTLLDVFENVCFLSAQVFGMVCFVPHEPKTLYRVLEVSRGRWHLPHYNITRPEDWLVCICGGWPISFTVYVFVNII